MRRVLTLAQFVGLKYFATEKENFLGKTLKLNIGFACALKDLLTTAIIVRSSSSSSSNSRQKLKWGGLCPLVSTPGHIKQENLPSGDLVKQKAMYLLTYGKTSRLLQSTQHDQPHAFEVLTSHGLSILTPGDQDSKQPAGNKLPAPSRRPSTYRDRCTTRVTRLA